MKRVSLLAAALLLAAAVGAQEPAKPAQELAEELNKRLAEHSQHPGPFVTASEDGKTIVVNTTTEGHRRVTYYLNRSTIPLPIGLTLPVLLSETVETSAELVDKANPLVVFAVSEDVLIQGKRAIPKGSLLLVRLKTSATFAGGIRLLATQAILVYPDGKHTEVIGQLSSGATVGIPVSINSGLLSHETWIMHKGLDASFLLSEPAGPQ